MGHGNRKKEEQNNPCNYIFIVLLKNQNPSWKAS